MASTEHVAQFLSEAKVEALAVSIGNAHGLYKGEPKLDFDLLQRINEIATVPLVLHGGTGLTQEQFALGVKLGIKKINIGTEVRRTFVEASQKIHEKNIDAWDLAEMSQASKNAVTRMVSENLKFFAHDWKELCK